MYSDFGLLVVDDGHDGQWYDKVSDDSRACYTGRRNLYFGLNNNKNLGQIVHIANDRSCRMTRHDKTLYYYYNNWQSV